MKATHTSTGAPASIADVLRRAALYLRRHGWHQGGYYATTDTPTPPACAVGAIGMAVAGHLADHFHALAPDTQLAYRQAVNAFTRYLDTCHPLPVVDDDGFAVEHTSPYAWNDDPTRTAGQVVTALQDAAEDRACLHHPEGENS